ncbi:sulfite exporter TauE/SafE family protein [Paenibacillus sp. y28]|uniref:sulfite exporter TauE/SafE family protein n=1 Tax=Paenibacillus sp. y28 TaxID=3129110 RepID=UPI00301926BF
MGYAWTLGLLFIIGLVSATFGSIVGLGGGIIIVPALVYLGPLIGEEVSTATAVGTSLAVLIITALASTLTFAKQKRVDFRSGWLLFITSGPGSIVGSMVTGLLEPSRFQLGFGIFMLLMALLMLLRDKLKPVSRPWPIQRQFTDASGTVWSYGYSYTPLLAIGFLVGLVSGLFGIGGGSLFVPAMVLLFGFPPHVATATSMFTILFSAVMGSLVHGALGEIHYWWLLILAPGAYVGGILGAKITTRLSGPALLWLLRLTLFVLSTKLIWEGLTG